MVTGKFHNEDLSIYFFIKDIVIDDPTTLGNVATIVDGYPYNDVESNTLTLPTVAIEAGVTSDSDVGELGASWFRRIWEVTVFAQTDVQRDDMLDKIFQALNVSIPIKDFSAGYNKNTGTSILGAALSIIENMNVDNRSMRPSYAFNRYAKIKYWKGTVQFETVSTQAS